MIAIREEFGAEEVLKRLSDPVWFQSLGCVIGFDWNSSGLTTTTMGALKEGIRGLEKELGIFICGGKGKTSRSTPEQIERWGEVLGFSESQIGKLVYASRISAKVDSSLVQDGYQIYHHNLVFSTKGEWAVIQQGMKEENATARRYHWLSSNTKKENKDNDNFIEEPHTGIVASRKVKPLNLTSKKSKANRDISLSLVKEEPKTLLKNLKLISEKETSLLKQKRFSNFAQLELRDVEFNWHPVLRERFDLKRLERTIFLAKEREPRNFEELLSLKGVGPRTIRALSLVAELIYGAEPSYEDPARYSFAVGGKDGTPFFVQRDVYDKLIEVIERGIKKSKISLKEKTEAQRRMAAVFSK
jgi:hypothetical protein